MLKYEYFVGSNKVQEEGALPYAVSYYKCVSFLSICMHKLVAHKNTKKNGRRFILWNNLNKKLRQIVSITADFILFCSTINNKSVSSFHFYFIKNLKGV